MPKFYDTNLSYRFTFQVWRIFLCFDWWYDVGMRKHKHIPLECGLTLLTPPPILGRFSRPATALTIGQGGCILIAG